MSAPRRAAWSARPTARDEEGAAAEGGRGKVRPEHCGNDSLTRSGVRRADGGKGVVCPASDDEASKEQDLVPADEVEDEEEKLEAACRPLFEAYDLDGSGEISRRELLRLELRRGFAQGDTFRALAAISRMSRMDRDRNGELCFHEFKALQKYRYHMDLEFKVPRPLVGEHMRGEAELVIHERALMGARFHLGVRRALEEVFYWLAAPTRGAHIMPEDWVAASHIAIAAMKPSRLQSTWFTERSFFEGDASGDGRLQLQEFLEVTFTRFEADAKLSCEELQALAQRIAAALQGRTPEEKAMLGPVPLLLQDAKANRFRLPPTPGQAKVVGHTGGKHRRRHHDELVSTGNLAREADEAYWRWGDIRIPLRLQRMEDVHSIVRLRLHLSPEIALSALIAAGTGGGGAIRGRDGVQVVLLKDGNLPGRLPEVSCASWVAAVLTRHSSTREICRGLFIKNVRSMPPELPPAPVCNAGEALSMGLYPLPQGRGRGREQQRRAPPKRLWLLHWRTHMVEPFRRLPVMPPIVVGDALVLRMPRAIGAYSFTATVHMTEGGALAPPELEAQSGGGGGGGSKSGKRGKHSSPGRQQESAKDKELTMQAVKTGTARVFVELNWEVHEEDVAFRESLASPVGHNSVARLGPIDIEVEEPEPEVVKRAVLDVSGPGPRSTQGASGAGAESAGDFFQTVFHWTGSRWKESRRKIRQRRQNSKKDKAGSKNRVKSGGDDSKGKGARSKSAGSATSGASSDASKVLKGKSKGKKRQPKHSGSQMEAVATLGEEEEEQAASGPEDVAADSGAA